MDYNGQVTKFDSKDHSYLVCFSFLSEDMSISDGSAQIQLKIGDTKIDIHNAPYFYIDNKTYRYLKSRFLKTIYDFNVSRALSFNKHVKS